MANLSRFRCPACKFSLVVESRPPDIRLRCPVCGAGLIIKQSGSSEPTVELNPPTGGREAEPPYAAPVPSAETDYRYSAFISYRHVDPDRRWAQWLHERLETFRTPAALIRSRCLKRRLKPVFRDMDELPASSQLNDQIEFALRQAQFLIVICSRQTPASRRRCANCELPRPTWTS